MIAVLVSLGIIVLIVGGLLVGGLWVARRYTRVVPGSELSKEVDSPGFVSAAIFVTALTMGSAVAVLAPTSSLGIWLSSPLGVFSALVALIVVATALQVAIALLKRMAASRDGSS